MSGKDRAHHIKFQNYALDMLGEVIEPDWDYTMDALEGIKGYLEGYIAWENNIYTRLAGISNQLIVMGFPCEAELVREGLPRKNLEKVQRMLTEYGLSEWDMTYILPADKALHDRMKKKEKY